MPPKKKTVSSRFKHAPSTRPRTFRERRSKFREDPSRSPSRTSSSSSRSSQSPPPPPGPSIQPGSSSHQPPIPPTPVSPSSQTSVPSVLSTRAFTTGRRVDFDFLASEGFEFGEGLKYQGWEYLCSGINIPTYPNLVRAFYKNAKVSPRSFESEVKGVRINLTVEKLGSLLRAPTEGAERLDDRASGLRLLFGREDAMHFEEIHARHLSVEHRLLHHITARILVPRIGRFDFLNKNDIAVMYHILTRQKFNLPALILRVMQEASQREKPALPYGMFLTLVFQDFGVSFEDEPSKKLQFYDTYNLGSMKRMKFKKIGGIWRKMDDEAEARPEPESEPLAPPPAPAPAPSSSTVRLNEDQIEEIVERVCVRLTGHLPALMENAVRKVFAEQRSSSSDPPGPSLD